jgi:phosphate transport system substrate-binding protein
MALLRRFRVLLVLTMVLAVVAAACGGDDSDSGGDDGGNGGGDSSGEAIVVSGSSTVEPITALVAEASGNPNITVSGPGTSDGFELFCAGETDISDASRPISAEEVAACEAGGVEFIELEVAIDGLSVITSVNNDQVECLSFADLYALAGPESEGFTNWSDAQDLATELGSTTTLPDAELVITAPGEESGTYGSFIEIALADIAEARLESGDITEEQEETTRPDYSSSPNDNTIIEGIAGSDTSFGWVGFAFASENSDQVKTIAIDGGDGCVEPTEETISDGTYPISRSLFIYVNSAKVDANSALPEFVDFYMEGLTTYPSEAGYVTLPEDRIAATQATWDARTTGTVAGGE